MANLRYKRRFGRSHGWLALITLSGVLAAGACKSEGSGTDESTVSDAGAGGSAGALGEGGAPTGGLGQLSHAGTGAELAGAGEGSGEGGGAGSHCGESRIEATKRPVSLLLLVDRSASMDSPPVDASVAGSGTAGASGDAGGAAGATSVATKWDLLKEQLVDSLGEAQEDLSYGMLLFPASDDVALAELMCEMSIDSTVQVPVAPGTEALADIDALLEDTPPAGNTPTAAALARALEYFTTGKGRELEGDKYVLLATDGGPNCNSDASCEPDTCIPNIAGVDCGGPDANCCEYAPDQCIDEQATSEALEELREAGVKTFIVGIPGSELFSDFLDDFAVAGGLPRTPTSDAPHRYYAVEAAGNMQGLSEVLVDITGSLITRCDLQLDEDPPDVFKLNVYVDGAVVPQAGDDGWSVEMDTSPPTIHIKGKTCQRIETEGARSVSIQYGCPTVILL
jgi:hypothetical protein